MANGYNYASKGFSGAAQGAGAGAAAGPLGALAGGDSIEDVLADYPSVTAEDLSAVFAFAGSLAQFEDIPYSESVVAQ